MQSLQCISLDLPDTFPGQTKGLADFLQRLRFRIVEAEPHSQNRRLALVHFVEHLEDVPQVVAVHQLDIGAFGAVVSHDFAERPGSVGLICLRVRVVKLDGLLEQSFLPLAVGDLAVIFVLNYIS